MCTTLPASITSSYHLHVDLAPDSFLPQCLISVATDESAVQIMVSVAEKNQRPDIPQEAEKLPGGTFEGWDTYVGLIQRCWGPTPAERPTFEAIINDLRGLLTESASQTRQRRLTDPLSPGAAGNSGGELPQRSGAAAGFLCLTGLPALPMQMSGFRCEDSDVRINQVGALMLTCPAWPLCVTLHRVCDRLQRDGSRAPQGLLTAV